MTFATSPPLPLLTGGKKYESHKHKQFKKLICVIQKLCLVEYFRIHVITGYKKRPDDNQETKNFYGLELFFFGLILPPSKSPNKIVLASLPNSWIIQWVLLKSIDARLMHRTFYYFDIKQHRPEAQTWVKAMLKFPYYSH